MARFYSSQCSLVFHLILINMNYDDLLRRLVLPVAL